MLPDITHTSRLQLTKIKASDAAFLCTLMNTKGWHQFIGDRKISSEEDARAYIHAKMSSQLSDKGFVNYVMTEKASGLPVGTCSIHDREGVEGLDIGYALMTDFEGMGYATEGAKHMIQLVFEVLKRNNVSAITTEANRGSCKVLERIGFKEDGTLILPGSDEKLKRYVLVNEP